VRYHQLLESTELSIEDALKLIETKGQPWLNATDWYLPFSGRKRKEDIFVGNYHVDRKSSSGNEAAQDIIDKRIRQEGGNALRSNSIFVTTSLNTASEYSQDGGEIYYVLPLGDFQYHWYPKEPDLIASTEHDFIVNKSELQEYGITLKYYNFLVKTANDFDLPSKSYKDLRTVEDIALKNYRQDFKKGQDFLNAMSGSNVIFSLALKDKNRINNIARDVKININTGIKEWISTEKHELVVNSNSGYLAINTVYFMRNYNDKFSQYKWNVKMLEPFKGLL